MTQAHRSTRIAGAILALILMSPLTGAGDLLAGSAPPSPIDVNAATAGELTRLPGIGPVKARAIVAYRTEHGPFRDVEELKKVKGIGAKTLEKIRPYLTVSGKRGGAPPTAPPRSAAPAGKVNVNAAGSQELQTLSGVGAASARRIVAYREMHGPYHRLEDLVQVKGIGPKTVEKFRKAVLLVLDVNRASVRELRAFGFKNAKEIVSYRSSRGRFSSPDDLAKVPGADVAFLRKVRKLLR